MSHETSVERRAGHLLRWYPRTWRERYGEEFTELLIADLTERPRCRRRSVDIAASGLVARLSVAGLGGSPVGQAPATLAAIALATVGFLACGASLWSQLVLGSRWSAPEGSAVTLGVLVMTIAAGYLAVLALLATVPVTMSLLRSVARGRGRSLIGPLTVLAVAVTVLLLGGHQLQSGWPGIGGHRSPSDAFVPGWLASFGWAETLAITAYWAHPGDLLTLPDAQLTWIVVSPAAFVAAVVSAGKLVRRIPLSPAVMRFERRIAAAAAVGMLAYLVVAARWVLGSRSGSNEVLRAGSLDLLLIATMTAALALTRIATRGLDRVAAR